MYLKSTSQSLIVRLPFPVAIANPAALASPSLYREIEGVINSELLAHHPLTCGSLL